MPFSRTACMSASGTADKARWQGLGNGDGEEDLAQALVDNFEMERAVAAGRPAGLDLGQGLGRKTEQSDFGPITKLGVGLIPGDRQQDGNGPLRQSAVLAFCSSGRRRNI